MDEEIEEKLKEKFDNSICNINVEFKDFRRYKIFFNIEKLDFSIEFTFIYDNHFAIDANVNTIKNKIEYYILKFIEGRL